MIILSSNEGKISRKISNISIWLKRIVHFLLFTSYPIDKCEWHYRSSRLLLLLMYSSNRKKYTKCFHFSHSKFSNPNNITDDWQCLNEWKISLRLAKFKENYSLPFIRFVSIEPTYTSMLLHSSNRKTFIRNVFTFLILNFPNNIFDDWQCSNKGKISFRELFTSFHKKRYKTFSLLNFPNNIMIGNVRTNEKISLGELFASYRSMRLTLLSHSSNEEKGIRFHFSHSKFSNPNNIMIGNVRTNEEISLGELFASFCSLRIDRSTRMTSVELTYTSLLLCLSCATNGGRKRRGIRNVSSSKTSRYRARARDKTNVRMQANPVDNCVTAFRGWETIRSPPLFSTQQFLPPTFFLSIVDNNLAIFDQLSSFFFHFQKERFKF